jgi:hypothetical protein
MRHNVSVRKLCLLSIRIDHLTIMEKLGALRKLDVAQVTISEICEFLEEHGQCFILALSHLLTNESLQ